jgi:hypothetical protein
MVPWPYPVGCLPGIGPWTFGRSHGELFVVELAVAFGLVKQRGRNLATDFVAGFWIGSLIQPLLGGGFG